MVSCWIYSLLWMKGITNFRDSITSFVYEWHTSSWYIFQFFLLWDKVKYIMEDKILIELILLKIFVNLANKYWLKFIRSFTFATNRVISLWRMQSNPKFRDFRNWDNARFLSVWLYLKGSLYSKNHLGVKKNYCIIFESQLWKISAEISSKIAMKSVRVMDYICEAFGI